ncbi:MAG: cyclic nucleotide-binding domain-containing protein [Deltaproteobacteria bacterium]|jgi:CRP-like cAMP-binding protein|nr:cyclic nucleotide-binding domain-containing protein [Deltaproteobacteria bacterium]
MYFKQGDIFWGMNKEFVGEIMKVAVTESYNKGDMLFRKGDSADHFYIMTKGQIKLSIGETGYVVYIVSKAGEAFGWSSLIGRDVYSATAECMSSTNLLKLNGEKLQKILEKDSDNGLIFFKRLSMVLGNRLLESYKMISSATQTEASISYGTGQVVELEAIER